MQNLMPKLSRTFQETKFFAWKIENFEELQLR